MSFVVNLLSNDATCNYSLHNRTGTTNHPHCSHLCVITIHILLLLPNFLLYHFFWVANFIYWTITLSKKYNVIVLTTIKSHFFLIITTNVQKILEVRIHQNFEKEQTDIYFQIYSACLLAI